MSEIGFKPTFFELCDSTLKAEILEFMFSEKGETARKAMVAAVAQKLKTREKSVAGFRKEEILDKFIRHSVNPLFKRSCTIFVQDFVRHCRNEALCSLLNILNIAHESGQIKDDLKHNFAPEICLKAAREAEDKLGRQSAKFLFASLAWVNSGDLARLYNDLYELLREVGDPSLADKQPANLSVRSAEPLEPLHENSQSSGTTRHPETQSEPALKASFDASGTSDSFVLMPDTSHVVRTLKSDIPADEQQKLFALKQLHIPLSGPKTPEKADQTDNEDQFRAREKKENLISPETKYGRAAFTLLDELIVEQCRCSHAYIFGTMQTEDMGKLIEEIRSLNASRVRTYFHVGYHYGLKDSEPKELSENANIKAKSWALAGYVCALAEQSRDDKISKLFQDRKTEIADMYSTCEGISAGVIFVPIFYKALMKTENHLEAMETLDKTVLAVCEDSFRRELLNNAAKQYRRKKLEDAKRYIYKLIDAIEVAKNFGLPVDNKFIVDVRRREAQCLKGEGNFDNAVAIFKSLPVDMLGADYSDTLTDIGLSKGGFRWLCDADIPTDKEATKERIKNIEMGLDLFIDALSYSEEKQINANYILGVHGLLDAGSRSKEETYKYLKAAYEGACRLSDIYMQTEVLPKLKLYYALSIFLSEQTEQFENATDYLHNEKTLPPYAQWPQWLIIEAFQNPLKSSGNFTERLMTLLKLHFPEILDEYSKNETLRLNPEYSMLRELYSDRFLSGKATIDDWESLSDLAQYFSQSGQGERAQDLVGAFEDAAIGNESVRGKYIEFLKSDRNYMGILEESYAKYALARMYEMNGDLISAIETYRKLFWLRVSQNLDEAGSYLEQMKILGPTFDCTSEESRLQQHTARSEKLAVIAGEEPVKDNRKAKLIVVGGAETQARQEEAITTKIKEKYPNVELEFIRTGWESNWKPYSEKVKSMLSRSKIHAVIISHYLRTNLGRDLRSICDEAKVRWYPLTGKGRGLCIAEIELALRMDKSKNGRSSVE